MQWRRSATWLAPCLVAVLAAVSLSGLGYSPRHAGKRHLDVLKKTEVDLSAALEAAGWADGPLSPMVSGSNDGDDEFPPALAPAPATLIPKVIHFTWKHSDLDELPEHFLAFQNKWRKLNPNWLVVVWSDEDMVNIVSRYYPDWSRRMASRMLAPVIKADVFRLMLMETFGGVYADMDMEPVKPLDELLERLGQPACVLGREPREHAVVLEGGRELLCNAMIASSPGHPLWTEVLRQIYLKMTTGWGRYDPNPDPVSLSGPRRLTEVVEDNPSLAKDCALLPPEAFYPYPDNSAKLEEKCLRLLAERAGAEEVEACARVLHLLRQEVKMAGGGGEGELGHPVGTYAVHHWTHTWIPRHKGKFESHTVGGG
ncbi:glycosyltransferase [Chloropicon roscoffensis]|uniref:Glycosyltransferase n=1 Tax=Chloropicon roscoffensis TaxID=1461544 RepID=A0AAX4PNM0_9CHLO